MRKSPSEGASPRTLKTQKLGQVLRDSFTPADVRSKDPWFNYQYDKEEEEKASPFKEKLRRMKRDDSVPGTDEMDIETTPAGEIIPKPLKFKGFARALKRKNNRRRLDA